MQVSPFGLRMFSFEILRHQVSCIFRSSETRARVEVR